MMVDRMSGTQAGSASGTERFQVITATVQQGRPVSLWQQSERNSIDPLSGRGQEEMELFQNFVTNHIVRMANANAQCMLIWTEWVRFHLQHTKKFPRFILEEEFREKIAGLFSTAAILDEHRGRVYPGLRFVP